MEGGFEKVKHNEGYFFFFSTFFSSTFFSSFFGFFAILAFSPLRVFLELVNHEIRIITFSHVRFQKRAREFDK